MMLWDFVPFSDSGIPAEARSPTSPYPVGATLLEFRRKPGHAQSPTIPGRQQHGCRTP